LAGGGAQDRVQLMFTTGKYVLPDFVENLEISRYTDVLIDNSVMTASGNDLANKIVVNDAFSGSSEALYGMGGNDRMSAGSGNDTVDGGTGADTLLGGTGDDLYVVDNIGDVAIEAANGGADTLSASISYTLGIAVENLVLTGTAAINGTGNSGSNTLTGNDAANSLSGADGNDQLLGNGGADTLIGGNGDDVLDGGSGADSTEGGTGDDTYYLDNLGDKAVEAANAGTDTVISQISYTLAGNLENLTLIGSATKGIGNSLANVIFGNEGDNDINGSDGNDTLIGGGGNDTLTGGSGNDAMNGGLGNDTYFVDSANDIVTESSALLMEIDKVASTVTWTLGNNVENLKLSGNSAIDGSGNTLSNTLVGNDAANHLYGLGGDDTFTGGAGNDTIDGGSGIDTMRYDSYATSVTVSLNTGYLGGTGNSIPEGLDTLNNIEVVVGSGQNDSIRDGSYYRGSDNLFDGGAGNDSLDGGDGNDTLIGGAGNDTLFGGIDVYTADIDLADYSAATAAISGNIAGAIIGAGTGTDTLSSIEWLIATKFNDSIVGSTGNDRLDGGAGNDTLTGGDGNDSLEGGVGTDSMTGGAGNDTYYVDVGSDVIIEIAVGGTDTVVSQVSNVLDTQLENLVLTGTANLNATGNASANILNGNAGDNLLIGLAGNDTILGFDGNDTIRGGLGADSLDGGNGTNTLDFSDVGSGITGSFGAYSGYTLKSGAGDTIHANSFTNVIGSGFADSLTGDFYDNSMSGGAGNDTLLGGSGDDTLVGGDGNDSIDGGYGFDITSFSSSATAINFDLSAGTAIGQGADIIINVEGAIGSAGADTLGWTSLATNANTSLYLDGGAGNDTLTGSNYNDILVGGTGNDSMIGGTGNDTYYVDSAADIVVDSGGYSDTISSSINIPALLADIENLILTGTAITGTGNSSSNRISGNDMANVLSGGLGSDTLSGGLGADTLNGGVDTGYDQFTFNSVGDSTALASDVITDYDDLRDNIDLSGIDADKSTTYNDYFNFVGTADFSGVARELRYEIASDGLSTTIYGDVDGDKIADFILKLTGSHTLNSGDFYT
jgi:Ca2+-binding RTX toxin-like protein